MPYLVYGQNCYYAIPGVPFHHKNVECNVKDKKKTERNELVSIVKGIQQKRAANFQLPLWSEAKRGTPNSFLRSALFAAVQSKDRVWFERAILASQEGLTVQYTGRQLNQDDLSVWETLVHHARPHQLGCILEFSANDLLRSLDLPTGGTQHDILNATIDRLTACSVSIIGGGKGYGGSLFEAWQDDEKTRNYKVRINRELASLFSDSQWTGINWEQRKRLRKKPLAQYLHAHYSSHKKPFPYKMETLYAYSGSRNKSIRGFKQKLIDALGELVSIEFLKSFYIDKDNMVHVERHGVRDTA